MPNQKYLLNRRRFLATTAVATGAIAMPSILRAQGAPVKLGVLHPVTGALSYSGQQGRLGATLAIEEINAAGGIKGLGKIDPVLGDAQSTPEGGTAEVEKMNSAGVAAIAGAPIAHSNRTAATHSGRRGGMIMRWMLPNADTGGTRPCD